MGDFKSNESESNITNVLDELIISRFCEYKIEISQSDALQLADLYIRGAGLYDIIDDNGKRIDYRLYVLQVSLSLRTHFAICSKDDIMFNDSLITRIQTDMLYYYDNLDYCTVDRSIIENNIIPILIIIPDFINSCRAALYHKFLDNPDLYKHTYFFIGDDSHPCSLALSIRRINKDIEDDYILTIVSNATSMIESDKITLLDYSFKPEYRDIIDNMDGDSISSYYKRYTYKINLNNEEA